MVVVVVAADTRFCALVLAAAHCYFRAIQKHCLPVLLLRLLTVLCLELLSPVERIGEHNQSYGGVVVTRRMNRLRACCLWREGMFVIVVVFLFRGEI